MLFYYIKHIFVCLFMLIFICILQTRHALKSPYMYLILNICLYMSRIHWYDRVFDVFPKRGIPHLRSPLIRELVPQ